MHEYTFRIERFSLESRANLEFFDWLEHISKASHKQTMLFNSQLACGYAHYDALATWQQDRCYRIQSTPVTPARLVHFITSGGRRIFAGVVYDRNKVVLIEITPVQLFILPAGIRTDTGQLYQPPLHPIIAAPDDKVPVLQSFADNQEGIYLGFREEEDEADPMAKPLTDIAYQSNPPPAALKRLVFDVGHPSLMPGRVNMDAALLSLLD